MNCLMFYFHYFHCLENATNKTGGFWGRMEQMNLQAGADTWTVLLTVINHDNRSLESNAAVQRAASQTGGLKPESGARRKEKASGSRRL